MNNLYAIGDIHGYLGKLKKLIEKINPQEGDSFVFTGDYVDRGPDSKGVINFLLEFSKKYECVFLKGNHEDIMLNYINKKCQTDFQLWAQIGGLVTINSYDGDIFSLPQSHIDFFKNLKIYFETEKYFFAHAGIDPEKSIEKHADSDFMWIRDEFILHPTNFHKKVIYGHTPEMFTKKIHDDKICIDGGVAYGGNILAIKLPDEIILNA